ncbi:PREDICTED: 52 kDa repressor of the inhibitor of the protein kinase-like [Priapulus caudatus]|uniref:52 kDa repressor of the inhibitor of the protein kinase-like n=1 Tax=Priapulus caudatus TaxID=37621 RepID=A0ABM1ENB8_PRICU|nr:PREDICTED: 52 kDa repressor of the inhibitor of the protein kinase-like [Priapulus caudatus]
MNDCNRRFNSKWLDEFQWLKKKHKQIKENGEILKHIGETVLYCGRQNIPLRGDYEASDTSFTKNPGNFIARLKLLSKHSSLLQKHLQAPAKKNATYISPQSQNELIDVIGHKIIRETILEEVRKTRWFSVMCDEATSHNAELMSLCVRFVDTNCQMREEFIDFIGTCRTTGRVLASKILQKLEELNLDVTKIRGQGYDGAAAMSSARVGVQGIIKQHSPRAIYTHCLSHALNLVYAHSAKQQEVRNMLDKLKESSVFFSKSPRREGPLKEIVGKNVPEHATNRKPLLDICATRWAARYDAFRHFYQCYVWQVMALEVIVYGSYINETDKYDGDIVNDDWDGRTKTAAGALLEAITKFGFIVTFLTVYEMLSPMQGLTVKLQGKAEDMVSAYDSVTDVKLHYETLRGDVEAVFHRIYEHSVRRRESLYAAQTRRDITIS